MNFPSFTNRDMFYTSYESICASILNATIRFREIYGFMQAETEL